MSIRTLFCLLAITVSVGLFSAKANAQTGDSGWRDVVGFGCHLGTTTCYIDISGASVGPTDCLSSSIRFSTDTPNGNVWVSMVEGAYLSGRQMRFQVSDSCYTVQPTFPTFLWGRIAK